jgi:cellulose synthase/poly-beta-1,6-N-acetylglucosamine synthase-like glycosyltransferase
MKYIKDLLMRLITFIALLLWLMFLPPVIFIMAPTIYVSSGYNNLLIDYLEIGEFLIKKVYNF